MRDIIEGGASSVRRSDRKVIYLLLSYGFFFSCNGLYTETRGLFKLLCHDINYSRKQ